MSMAHAAAGSAVTIPDDVFDAVMREHDALPQNEGEDKVVPLADAVAKCVRPGIALYLGFVHARAHAAGFEIIRQFGDRNPRFHLITAGVLELGLAMVHRRMVERVTAAYAGNTYPLPSPNRIFREAVAAGRLTVEESTNLTVTLRLMAGALGLPFMPTRSVTGTGLATAANGYREIADPFAPAQRIGVLGALRPDHALIHAYAADRAGNALLLAPYGEEAWGALASRDGVLLTVEKLVSTEFIRRHAHLVRIPAHVVRSVSIAPFGAHPQPMTVFGLPGHAGYGEDYEFRRAFQQASRTDVAMDAWIDEWVVDCADHERYLARLGSDRLDALRRTLAEDAWRLRLADALAGVDRDTKPSAAETMIVLAAREIVRKVRAQRYTTVLAGAGVANLAAWLAVSELKRTGVDVELMAEAGFFGYSPRLGDPYVFAVANMYSNKMHSGFAGILGTLAGGPDNRCLAVVGAGQVDCNGNINSTRQTDGSYLVGSGGANDLGNTAREVLVLCTASPHRLVAKVDYVTTSGARTTTLVTPLGTFEKADPKSTFRLSALAPAVDQASAAARVDEISRACAWPLQVVPDVALHGSIEMRELATLRLFDPERIFTR